jgi:hypothetical protein
MRYPGRIIKKGESDTNVVKAVKKELNAALGIGSDPNLRLDPDNSTFGDRTAQIVKLFQSRRVDQLGAPLKQDGEIGSITWAALFGQKSVVSTPSINDRFINVVLRIAAGEAEKRVREKPKNSNKGPEVSQYLKRAGVSPGLAWCCAFVYWCFDEASKEMARPNPMVRTAGCLDHWRRSPAAGATRISHRDAKQNPSLVRPGMIFIVDHGRGLGHTGLIDNVSGGFISTIEGNTDASMTREGGGVYRLRRKITDINTGFIEYRG